MSALQVVKKGKNFVIYTDGKQEYIKLERVRVSFPHFGAKQVQKDEETGRERASWGGTAMLPKKTHEAARDALNDMIQKLIAANEVKVPSEYRCLKDGDDSSREEYEGHWVVSFSDSNRRPSVRDEFGKLMIDPERMHDPDYVNRAIGAIDDKFYGGCWINVMIRPWFFNGKAKDSSKTFPKRICAGFVGVQFVEDGEAFGSGRIDDGDAWDSVASDDDDDDGMGSSESKSKSKKSSDEDDL